LLSENVYVNKEGTNVSKISDKSIIIECPKCKCEVEVNSSNVNDLTDSDPHDPLEDFFICPYCNKPTGLFKGIKGCTGNKESLLWADGTFIYIKINGEDFRIV